MAQPFDEAQERPSGLVEKMEAGEAGDQIQGVAEHGPGHQDDHKAGDKEDHVGHRFGDGSGHGGGRAGGHVGHALLHRLVDGVHRALIEPHILEDIQDVCEGNVNRCLGERAVGGGKGRLHLLLQPGFDGGGKFGFQVVGHLGGQQISKKVACR